MKEFFDYLRKRDSGLFGTSLSQRQVDGLNTLLDAIKGLPRSHQAYLLATAYHETARTMQPIAEYGKGKGRPYGKPGIYGQAQYGRGYVQLTWDANYQKADERLGLRGALLENFDLAMRPDIAAKILVRGGQEGWFTGKKLSDYLPGDYVGARRIVNGTDKAEMIAGYARAFEAALAAVPHVSETPETLTRPAPHVNAPPVAPSPAHAPRFSIIALLRAALALLFKRNSA